MYDQLRDPLAFTSFLLTLLLPIGVGVWALRRTRNQADFFLGGRSLGRVVVALSAVSSGRSAWLVIALSGMAYKLGVAALWAVVGYTAVEAWQFVYLGRRLRVESEQTDSLTLLDYFEARLGDRKHLVRITGAIIIGLFTTAYVAAQFNAGAKTLSAALAIPLPLSLLIAAALILVYMVLGGFVAVAYNDVVRAVIMLIGLVVLPVVAVIDLGGPGAMLSILEGLHPRTLDPLVIGAGAIVGFVAIGLGSPGQPHIVVRYLAIDKPEHLPSAAVIGTTWNLLLGLGAVCIGLVGRARFPEVSALPDQNAELVYLALSGDTFGPLLFGLVVGGIFAAILSTADSQLLVVASTLVLDLGQKVIWKTTEAPTEDRERRQLRASRLVVVAAGLVAMLLAWVASDLVFWLVLFAWGGLGASLGPALLFTVFWRRTTRWGVLAGMLTGTFITVGWKLWLRKPTGLYELIPAFALAALAVLIVSLLTPRSRPD